jgi:pilus assembly protein Flp/PilA
MGIKAAAMICTYQRINPLRQGKPQRGRLSRLRDHGRNSEQGNRNMRTKGTPDLLRDERAATAIEYGLIAALISLACIIAFQMLGLNLANIFNTINNALN